MTAAGTDLPGLTLYSRFVLELVVVARYASAIDWGKPLAISYILFLLLGLIVTGAALFMSRRSLHDRPSH